MGGESSKELKKTIPTELNQVCKAINRAYKTFQRLYYTMLKDSK